MHISGVEEAMSFHVGTSTVHNALVRIAAAHTFSCPLHDLSTPPSQTAAFLGSFMNQNMDDHITSDAGACSGKKDKVSSAFK